jgi:hypothetical protein
VVLTIEDGYNLNCDEKLIKISFFKLFETFLQLYVEGKSFWALLANFFFFLFHHHLLISKTNHKKTINYKPDRFSEKIFAEFDRFLRES